MTGWAALLNGVLITGGAGTPHVLSGDCNTDVDYEVGCLTKPPDGLGHPELRTEDVTYAQRDGTTHFNDWYEPRQITLEAIVSDNAPYVGCTARQGVQRLSNAWKRTCDDTELVLFAPCNGDENGSPVINYNTPLQTRTNYALNPAAVEGGEDAEYGTRWNWTRSWETGTGPSGGPATFARYVAPDSVSGASSRGVNVYGSTGAASPGTTTYWLSQPVTPGETITASVWLRVPAATNLPPNFYTRIRFHDGAGNWVGDATNGTYVPVVLNEWKRVSLTLTVPAGAAYITGEHRVTTYDQTVGDTIDATGLLIERHNTVNEWFSGTSPNSTTYRHQWSGLENSSPSTRISYATEVRRNYALNPAAVFGGEDAEYLTRWGWTRSWETGTGPIPEISSWARFTAPSNQAAATVRGVDAYGNIGDTNPGTSGDWTLLPVTPGEEITVSRFFRMTAATPPSYALIHRRFHDGAGNWVGSEITAPAIPIVNGEWARIYATFTVPPGVTHMVMRIFAGTFDQTTGDTIDVTGLLIERSATVNSYFDGGTQPSFQFNETEGYWETTAWVGSKDSSHSILATRTPDEYFGTEYTGAYGIVGRPRQFQVEWYRTKINIAKITMRFDAVDHRIYLLTSCGKAGVENCVTAYPSETSTHQRCYSTDRCYDRCYDQERTDVIQPATLLEVGGTLCPCPTITLHGPLVDPYLVTNTGERIGYSGELLEGESVVIDGETATATNNKGEDVTYRIQHGTFCLPLGTSTLSFFSETPREESGTVDICWREAVVTA